jgi:cytochrome c biogenesis protein CcmG/thiol:disulfide interchange protein DsbE
MPVDSKAATGGNGPANPLPVLLGAGIVTAMLLLGACVEPERPFVKAESDRQAAPAFSLRDASGAPFTLSDYRGKVVLLNFWATWCGPCREEIPSLIGLEREFKDRNFAVLGISLDQGGWDPVKPYIARRKVNYRVAIGDESLAELYGHVEGLPTTFMIDRQGRIARIHVGFASEKTYREEILQLTRE